jgi:predicted transposase YbfD/YdcC
VEDKKRTADNYRFWNNKTKIKPWEGTMEIIESDIIRMQESLAEIEDPRRGWGNIRHKLVDMLVIALSSVITGEDEFEAMEDWGKERREWFGTFLELPHGIPDADTFRRLFERINPKELLNGLNLWLPHAALEEKREVNLDGKTLRGSGGLGRQALHVVSAWVGEHDLVLGQLATDEESNEITAIPQVLDMIDVKGDVVTIDAMGCQAAIAEKIRERGADYILAVKENQPSLYADIRDYFEYLESKEGCGESCGKWESELEKGHGRIERRSAAVVTQLGWLEGSKAWKDLAAIIRYRCSRTVGEATTITDRYYISSMAADAKTFARLIRGHWSIENRLHWSLDVLFREDASQVKKGNAPLNLNILRKIALSRLRATAVPEKRFSTKRKIFKARVNQVFHLSVLFQK